MDRKRSSETASSKTKRTKIERSDDYLQWNIPCIDLVERLLFLLSLRNFARVVPLICKTISGRDKIKEKLSEIKYVHDVVVRGLFKNPTFYRIYDIYRDDHHEQWKKFVRVAKYSRYPPADTEDISKFINDPDFPLSRDSGGFILSYIIIGLNIFDVNIFDIYKQKLRVHETKEGSVKLIKPTPDDYIFDYNLHYGKDVIFNCDGVMCYCKDHGWTKHTEKHMEKWENVYLIFTNEQARCITSELFEEYYWDEQTKSDWSP